MAKEQQKDTVDDQGARQRLLEAAIALFAENGYAATSVREIVSKAGVTKPVLYYYFGSKEGLFRAIIDVAAEMQEEMIDRGLQFVGPTVDRLMNFYRIIYEKLSRNRDLIVVLNDIIFGPKRGVPKCNFHDFHYRMFETLKIVYHDGLKRGDVIEADPDVVVQLWHAMMDSAVFTELTDMVPSGSVQLHDMLQLAFQGLAPKE